MKIDAAKKQTGKGLVRIEADFHTQHETVTIVRF